MVVNLPNDIVWEILIRLPAKSIGRFRCLNKSWYKLLKHPKFVKMHFNHASQMNKLNFMLCSSGLDNTYKLYSVCYNPSSSTCGSPVSIGYPSRPDTKIEYYGSCNGLVCTSHELGYVLVWNPCTREYHKLPPFLVDYISWRNTDYLEYGFGYDNRMKVFKVVSLVGKMNNPSYCEVRVYTFGSNEWRRMENNIPYIVQRSSVLPPASRVTVYGAIHWVAKTATSSTTTSEVIISFHFRKETFKEISLPSMSFYSKTIYNKFVCVLAGSLCLAVTESMTCSFDVWQLKDYYGAGNSWSKLITVADPGIGPFRAMPLQILRNGEILFGIGKSWNEITLVLYDLNRGRRTRARTLHEDKQLYSQSAGVYVESLISIGSGTFLGKPPQGSDNVEEDSEENAGFERRRGRRRSRTTRNVRASCTSSGWRIKKIVRTKIRY